MNNTTNAAMQTAATVLITLGTTTVSSNLWGGLAELVAGALIYLIYELIPAKN